MANVDTNKHRALVLHLLREFQVEEVSAHFALNLLEHVRGLREIEFCSIARSNDLRWDLVSPVKLLMLVVKTFIAKDHQEHLGES